MVLRDTFLYAMQGRVCELGHKILGQAHKHQVPTKLRKPTLYQLSLPRSSVISISLHGHPQEVYVVYYFCHETSRKFHYLAIQMTKFSSIYAERSLEYLHKLIKLSSIQLYSLFSLAQRAKFYQVMTFHKLIKFWAEERKQRIKCLILLKNGGP